MRGPGSQRQSQADVEGRYEFTQLAPGRYTVSASKSPLIERAFGQRYPSEPGTPLDLADRQTLVKIDIALVRGAVIAGRVIDDLGDPIPNFGVNVMRRVYRDGRLELTNVGKTLLGFADDESRWTPRSRFCAAVRPGQQGRYVVRGLPPGEYRAVALEFFEDGRESDPEMLGRLKAVATAFTLAEGEHRVLALKLIRDEKER